jgi:hypothetical protein
MWNKLNDFYRNNVDNFLIHVPIPGVLASAVFIARKYDSWHALVVGVLATFLIPFHAYLTTKATHNKLKESELREKELDVWKKELDGHKWLLSTIKEMIIRKLKRFKNYEYPLDEKEYIDAVMKILDMLRQFYSHYADDPVNEFRVTFFKIGKDHTYLESQFYSTPTGDPPSSHGDAERQKEIFNKNRSQSLAVAIWRELTPKIAENEKEINYLYPQQKEKIKSIIGFPICSGDISEDALIGIITIASNKEFFKKADIKRHKEYIDQFILRIIFEYHKWEAFSRSKNDTKE